MSSLTRVEAADRAALIAVDSYHVDLDLTGEAGFRARTTVRFSSRRPGSATFVELRPDRVHSATLNGVALDSVAMDGVVLADAARSAGDGHRLHLPDLADTNTLVVDATMPYSNSGEGLHRFTDPADGRTYLFAHSFLDNAQRIFACFDQPDLKAPVILTVTAPAQWTVVANSAAEPDQGDPTRSGAAPARRWRFQPTPRISTYLFTLVAGPYHQVRAEHDGIPLGLYARASLAADLEREADELLAVTRASFDWYHERFGDRYPFGKYDQVFVPEFNPGAMENPGCVTFTDDLVYRSAVTEAQRQSRAVTVAHEMAHMWFGDLVTMRWWDDMWLNESFATYMGFRVVAERTRFTGAWTAFAAGYKARAYVADQHPSTHPVAAEDVPDTAAALLHFDDISYAKGAAVLRQLVVWLGDDAFFAGLRSYFAANRFGNATLADLLRELAASSGRDLGGWAQLWLRRPGANTLRPQLTVGPDGRYSRVELVQTVPVDHPVARPHRFALGLYTAGTRERRIEVELAGTDPVGVDELVGVPAADLLLVNDADLTYAKIRIDPGTVAGLAELLPSLGDPLARALVWACLADTVRDGELAPGDYLAVVAAALPAEAEDSLFQDVLRFAQRSVTKQYIPHEGQPAAQALLYAACSSALASAAPGSGRQLAAARGMASCAGTGDMALLRDWLHGTGVPTGLGIDAELRWTLLYRMVVVGAAGVDDIGAECARDRSSAGAEHAARCRAALVDPAAKAAAWRTLTDHSTMSNRLLIATADGFWQPEQAQLTEGYVPRYFTDMPPAALRRPPQLAAMLAVVGYPRYAVEPTTVAAAEELLARDDVPPGVRRAVVDATDDLRRAMAVRQLAGRL